MSETIRVTELLWKEINPTSTMDPPSMVYEIVERHNKTYLDLTWLQRKETSFEDFARLITKKDSYSKDEAVLILSWGYKITHDTFSKYEWFKKAEKSKIHFIDQKENVINMKQFWRYRTEPKWNTGWTVYKPKKK